MSIQVLIATMNQNDDTLLNQMNIQSASIVGNQCDRNEVTEFEHKGHHIQWLSFKERGVGLNRNNALMRATADIVMFADDDMIFVDNYPEIVQEAYEKIPQADVIIFDLQYPDAPRKPITKIERLSAKKCMRFGAARVSAKRSVLHFHNIHFNLCFGGGTQFGSGEDSLFLMECARKGLKIYSYPVTIAKLIHRESTWFKGYTDKFFYDKGVLFSQLFPQMCRPCALFHCFKYRKKYGAYGWRKAYSQMLNGISFTKKKL